MYKIAVDEYRFQVHLNWSRTQYYLVFNVGLVGVATGLTRFVAFPMTLVSGGLYLAGITCCVLSLLANQAQREYYRNTRDRLKEIEKLLKVQDVGIVTTSKMGGRARRFGRVATVNQLVLLTLLALDLLGALLMIGRTVWP